MTDYDQFGYGGASYPLSASTSNSLLQDADPSLFYALDFFASVLTTHMGERLLAEVAKTPAILGITAPVAAVVPFDPTPFLQEQQFQFPLLAVYRQKEKNVWKTIGIRDDRGEWAVDYILPPLTAGQMERISPILRSVGRIIMNRIENKMDPAYRGGTDVWALANLEEIWLEEAAYGGFAGTGNLVFPAWRGKLRVLECDVPSVTTSDMQTLAGIDTEEDLADPAGILTTLTDVVNTEQDLP